MELHHPSPKAADLQSAPLLPTVYLPMVERQCLNIRDPVSIGFSLLCRPLVAVRVGYDPTSVLPVTVFKTDSPSILRTSPCYKQGTYCYKVYKIFCINKIAVCAFGGESWIRTRDLLLNREPRHRYANPPNLLSAFDCWQQISSLFL